MSTRTFTESRPFGIGTRTEIRLDDRLVTLSLQAGDMLRSDGGLVWATVDGAAEERAAADLDAGLGRGGGARAQAIPGAGGEDDGDHGADSTIDTARPPRRLVAP